MAILWLATRHRAVRNLQCRITDEQDWQSWLRNRFGKLETFRGLQIPFICPQDTCCSTFAMSNHR